MDTPTNQLHTRTNRTAQVPVATEVGGLELNAADLKDHPAACPQHVMERLRDAALRLGLSIQVGAVRAGARLGRPRDGTWERFIEVTDERLPESLRLQKTVLTHNETWENAARRIGLWPTR